MKRQAAGGMLAGGLIQPEEDDLRRLLSRRVGNRLGFGACAGFLVLFYLMPRNSFIQHLFHCDFTFLIRYHRQVLTLH